MTPIVFSNMKRENTMSKPVFEDMFKYKEGRRNRKSFLLFMGAQFLISITMALLILLVVPHLGQIAQGILGLIVVAISIPLMFAQFVAMSQRCRDLNHSGLWVLLNFVPFVSMVFQIYLMVAKGTDGKNDYGDDPLKMAKA